MANVRYLVGTLADGTSGHIIVQENGKRFAWCKSREPVARITGLAADKAQVTCAKCKEGSLMWLIENDGSTSKGLAMMDPAETEDND